MTPLPKMIGLLVMLSSCSFVSCASKSKPILIGAATVHCQTDCVPVSKAFIKEHADWGIENIRLKAALNLCQKKP